MSTARLAEAANSADRLLAALATPIARVTVADAERIAADEFGLSGTAIELGGERNQNFQVVTPSGEFLLKVAGLCEPREIQAFENRALMAVAAVDPTLPVPRIQRTLSGETIGRAGGHDVRLMSFVPGVTLASRGASPALRRDVGRCCARLGRALRGLFDPAASRPLIWDMRQVAAIAALAPHLPQAQRAAVEPVFDRFSRHVLPALPALRAQVIHNDFNARNLLVDPASPDALSGIIDFGDIVHAPLVIDLAVAIAHQIRDEASPLDVSADVVAGFAAVLPLEEEEVALLPDLVAMRLAMGIAIRGWRSKTNPADANYQPHSNDRAMAALATLQDLGHAAIAGAMRAAAGMPAPPAPAADAESLALRRQNVLGPGLRQFYDFPFYPVRGQGVWLYDAAGTRYLDAYNNVAHVGHCHPEIVAAMTRQAATVTTNTRYLHHAAVEYAERLTATMPAELDMCVFTCTGTEANDLAWRLATAATGGSGVLAMRHAYHGNSTFVSALDGSMAMNQGLDWVARVDAPDVARHDPASYAAGYATAIEGLRARGHAPAAIFFDTTFASDGLHLPPAGFMNGALAELRAAGGLVVADEVQPGFGRLGTDMWGFRKLGFVPDIVTIGKPAGNGHPIGIVITRRAILESFFRSNRYFNTFGGNPVSCATGLAVLDVVEREGLQANALAVGAYLLDGLRALGATHGSIGAVRGSGFFIGVDIVDERGAPAPTEARRAMNAMARLGVLIGMTGPTKSMLKIRPPMVFAREHADRLVETLDRVLVSVERA